MFIICIRWYCHCST